MNMRRFYISILVAVILALAYYLAGCDQRIALSSLKGYSVEGAIVRDMHLRSIIASAQFKRNDTILTSARLIIENDTLVYAGGYYTKSFGYSSAVSSGEHYLKLVDSNLFRDSIKFSIPGTFNFTHSSLPGDRINPGGADASFSWSPSAGSNGCAYGVVKADSSYKINGYTGFVPITIDTLITVPRAAFRTSGNLDTGWYYIYVYAYAGAPEKMTSFPTAFPSWPLPNIVKDNIIGNWGAVVVSQPDSIHVVTQ
ncbi:MAG: hypothetical protein NTV06_09365 [candidate division Zixibacteria bacterium]|nr:hypothetical protein [candidate division Zixibacteria bacterium]